MYSVICPDHPEETRNFSTLDDTWSFCYDLAQEFGYAKVMFGNCFMGEYSREMGDE